jgi:hypothetical protein
MAAEGTGEGDASGADEMTRVWDGRSLGWFRRGPEARKLGADVVVTARHAQLPCGTVTFRCMDIEGLPA